MAPPMLVPFLVLRVLGRKAIRLDDGSDDVVQEGA